MYSVLFKYLPSSLNLPVPRSFFLSLNIGVDGPMLAQLTDYSWECSQITNTDSVKHCDQGEVSTYIACLPPVQFDILPLPLSPFTFKSMFPFENHPPTPCFLDHELPSHDQSGQVGRHSVAFTATHLLLWNPHVRVSACAQALSLIKLRLVQVVYALGT